MLSCLGQRSTCACTVGHARAFQAWLAKFRERELSATLEIIAFVKKTDDGELMINPFELPAEAVVARSRRQATNVKSVISHVIVRRAQESSVG